MALDCVDCVFDSATSSTLESLSGDDAGAGDIGAVLAAIPRPRQRLLVFGITLRKIDSTQENMLKLICLAVLACGAYAIVCPPNICDTMDCAAMDSCNGLVKKNGGFCGCCDSCITQLGRCVFCKARIRLYANAYMDK
ncbi:hypothetical protein MAR_035046 [Mya arenaria]|uniref:Uncharacterized protein n=1 Tax=Mya arenaria TaxID=6604 RepID=A0ABY7EL89_MYAAR|nr:hypothetical protein MAR_035046 [Mya arenaria]